MSYIKQPEGVLIGRIATTVTSGGSTALVANSRRTQQFTGVSSHTMVLPDATTMSVGMEFKASNRSTGTVTVNKNGGSLQNTVSTGVQKTFTLLDNTTAAGIWDATDEGGSTPGSALTRTALTGSGNYVVPAGVTEITVFARMLDKKLLANGNDASYSIKSDGSVWAWGNNTGAALGDNTLTSQSSPIQVVGSHVFTSIASGIGAVALKADGSAWTWGYGPSIGDNTVTSKSSPVAVVGGHAFVKITSSGGNGNVSALKADGSVWGWGENGTGQLGNNSLTNTSSPVAVVGGHVFVSVSTNSTSVALKSDGSAWAWGSNTVGQVGDNTTTNQSSPVAVVGGHLFVEAVVGAQCAFARKADGSIWAWGGGFGGRLGDNTATDKSSPVAVVGGHVFSKLSNQSDGNMVALKADGSAWTWGYGVGGVLGDNTETSKSSPVAVAGGHLFVEVSTDKQPIARKSDGSVWMWGTNTQGQLGDNSTTSKSSPVQVVGQYFAPLNSDNNTQELKKLVLTVAPAQSIAYSTGLFPTFGSSQIGGSVESFTVEYVN